MEDKIKLHFVTKGNVSLASYRMRILKPTELLNTKTNGKIEVTIGESPDVTAHVNCFSKHFDPKETLQKVLDLAGKTKTIFDVCDDHFDRDFSAYYTAMCKSVDLITCNSENMKARIQEVIGSNSVIINDPITFPRRPVSLKNDGKLFWFGRGLNALGLQDWLEYVDTDILAISDIQINHPRIRHVFWRPMLVEKRIEEADIVLIPTSKNDPWVKNKSPNRAVDALNAGKFVITDNEDIYKDLKPFIKIIDHPSQLKDIIEFVRKEPEKAEKMIKKGQEFISTRYSDQKILDSWLDVLVSLGLVLKYD